ncbi:MAG: excinuclease ABC subunit UvrC [Desulforhabdus sp.]|jgi:excinuclease ABC subunit C|nr:excinuclease ABC subunit UvrC [Desulforhabdus sp.]
MEAKEATSSSSPEPAETERHPLAGKVSVLPHSPGVYIFKDAEGKRLYVGKAIDLRKRVGSYFRGASGESVKTRALLRKATDLDYVITSTEKEALLLEASLIKRHRPRYNVILRDDKNYPAVRIDPRDPFPRLEIVRRFQKDGALYFGPYPSAHSVRETLKLLNQLFPLRQCKGKNLIPRERPCLNYSLGRCLGACAGRVEREQYGKVVEEVVLFLQGKTDLLQQQLRERMEEAAEALEFERAAFYRDRLQAVTATLEKQHIVSSRFLNQDVLGIFQEEHGTEIAILFVRQGVLVGQRSFDIKEAQGEADELLAAFIQQYYSNGRQIPDEILVPLPLESQPILEEWLAESKGKHVRIWPVKRGDRKHLLELAANNARERFASRRRWHRKDFKLLETLQRLLKLPALPLRMACVDISNIQGQHAVGGLVVFENGKPDKSSYRHYRIHSKSEPDDTAMMAEVIERLVRQDPELAASLDLLVLDGGKGQLNTVHRLLKEIGAEGQLPVISIAKEQEADRGEKGRGMYEKIYLPGRKNPLFLSRFPDILHLLQRLRDETHRFAITRYQSRHRSELLSSELDSLLGIGPRRRQLLLQQFGSLESLRMASREELEAVPGMPKSVAETIYDYFHEEVNGEE